METTDIEASPLQAGVDSTSRQFTNDCEPPPLPPKSNRSSREINGKSLKHDGCDVVIADDTPSLDSGCDPQNSSSCGASCTEISIASNSDSGCDVTHVLLTEKYDNVEENLEEISRLLRQNSEEDGDCDVEVIVHESGGNRESSWNEVVENTDKESRAREAVIALGHVHAHEHNEESPFGYKSWLLRLSHRRRLEILIAIGLFLWFSFFVVLAIFMNGKSSKTEDYEPGISTGGVPHRPGYIPNRTEVVIGYPKNVNHSWPVNHTVFSTTENSPKLTTSLPPSSSAPTTEPGTTRPSEASPHEASAGTAAQPNEPSTVSTGSTGSKTDAETSRVLNQLLYDLRRPYNMTELLKEPKHLIGIGRADITGPAADANMMGYANPNQVAGGIHMRQYARSFIIGQGRSRVVFVNVDACMGSMLVKLEVLKVLKTMYGDLYTAENMCISGTHTHSAPAGFLQDVLFQITSMGYIPETLKAMVDGIVESIRIAHENISPGSILINKGELLDSNINRSPLAYINNPESERKRYKYNVDKEMILLKFLDSDGKGIGMINWFPVHCTSMNNTNSLISGDNKGYAELLFEHEMDSESRYGESKFVAAFAQSNEGDVSPNTRGPHCIDSGLPCDNVHSTCDGKVHNCIATGPGKDMFESTKIIAKNQFTKAMELYKNANIVLDGPVQAVHQYIDMTNQTVVINSTHTAHTCKPAMGFSFAAGTTDGPGAFDFKQGDKSGNLFWRAVRNFLHSPSQQQMDCHSPKPILLDTGEMSYPYSWQPDVVDTQVFRIGQLLISSVPGEFTTMSGRRLRDAVLEVFSEAFPKQKFESVVAGLSNTYSDYIATFEEYHVQRYEGASTIFGPHTLSAYVQQYKKLAQSLTEAKQLQGGAVAHDIKDKLMSLLPGVIVDTSPMGYSFGDVLIEVNDTYQSGDIVSVQFVSGNPRNSPSANMTFLTVEREISNDTWGVVHTDASWETKYIWERSSYLGNIRGLSEVTVKWEISPQTPSGHYRINHHGHYKSFWGGYIYEYKGQSKIFKVFQNTTEV